MSIRNTRVRKTVIFVFALFALAAVSIVSVLLIPNTEVVMNVSDKPANNIVVQSATEEIAPIMDLKGVWTFKTPKGGVFEATVTEKSIEILMKAPGDASLVYWNGTFDPNQLMGAVVNSIVNEDASILSQSKSKEFTVGIDVLSFDYTQMGMTKKVDLHRE
jgi:hypothetical protein